MDVTKNIDNTTIAGRLKTVSWSYDSHTTGVVKLVYWIPTFQLTAKDVSSKGYIFTKLVNNPPKIDNGSTANPGGGVIIIQYKISISITI